VIITDKMVRFHARDTRLATLHNSAMYGPSHPAEAHICTVYGDDETPHSYLSVCLSVSYLCLSVFNAVSEKERAKRSTIFSPLPPCSTRTFDDGELLVEQRGHNRLLRAQAGFSEQRRRCQLVSAQAGEQS
jgi:hypothetical protein